MNVHFLKSFQKNYVKRIKPNKTLDDKFEEKLLLFINNPKDLTLKDHALKGIMKGSRSFSVTGDIRAVYYFKDSSAYFLDIGTHNQVY